MYTQGPKLSPHLRYMRVRISKCEAKIFVQANFRECKSIDQNIESQSACFFCCVKSSDLPINQFILCENKIEQVVFRSVYIKPSCQT